MVKGQLIKLLKNILMAVVINYHLYFKIKMIVLK